MTRAAASPHEQERKGRTMNRDYLRVGMLGLGFVALKYTKFYA